MKLIGDHKEKDGAGWIALIPEEPEDIWHAYNLIQEGDTLKGNTVRKVTQESKSTGSTSSQRVHLVLTITAEKINYDSQAGVLHVKGKNIVENQHVKMGAYHTLDLEVNRKFTLTKECWDMIHLERIRMACDPAQQADLAAVVMQEGLANICLVTPHTTVVRGKIDLNIPRKRKGFTAQHEKGLEKFYDQVGQALLRHLNFDLVKCVLIASPGFVKEAFYEHLFAKAAREGNKPLLEAKPKFVLVHASSGFKSALNEVLTDPAVSARLAETKATEEVRTLALFHELLMTDPARAYYGMNHVEKANEAQAIETLMVSDSLFRSKDVKERKRYVALVELVKDQGANVQIFSSLHVSGEQLTQLSGVAAILRFPMAEIEAVDDDDDEDDDDDSDDN